MHDAGAQGSVRLIMRPPPTRYKVVERGRRLEVIDTLTGQPASRPSVPRSLAGERRREEAPRGTSTPALGARPATAESAGIDSDVFVTRRWYDDKPPRRLRLNFSNRARLTNLRYGIAIAVALFVVLSFWFWPLAVFAIFALVAGPKLRAQLRAASTSWLDQLDQAA